MSFKDQRSILITGATGLLGPHLVEKGASVGRLTTLARSNADIACDLRDLEAARSAIQKVKPDIVLHAAALTNVDECELDPEAAENTNHRAVANIVDAMRGAGLLVFFSSIAVYPDEAGPHKEGTEAPVNIYGSTKLRGEQAAFRHPNALIFRAAMFGPSRNPARQSLSDFIIAKLRRREPIDLFEDELFSPLHVATLATLAFEAAKKGLTGVYNAASRDGLTKAEFGMSIASWLNLPTDMVRIKNSRTVEKRTKRALDMRLDPSRLEQMLAKQMPSLEQEIRLL